MNESELEKGWLQQELTKSQEYIESWTGGLKQSYEELVRVYLKNKLRK